MPKTLKLRAGSVDLAHGRMYRRETRLALTTLEAGLLAYLSERPGEEVSRDTLLEAVWDQSTAVITRAVDNTVTRLRAKIEVDPKDPDHIVTVRGVGYRFEPLGAGTLPNYNDPGIIPSRLLGRDEALHTLEALINDGATPVTVTGPGGIGKTSLAQAFGDILIDAGEVRDALFMDLSEASDSSAMLMSIARALGVPQVDPEGLALLPALRGRSQELLILDNAEQLLPDVRAMLTRWFDHTPSLKILVTSRIRLGLPKEAVLTLGPLPADAATDLFIERGRRVRPGYEPDASEQLAIEALVERLDRLPLAIELAASRVGVLGPRDLLERLDAQMNLSGHRPGDVSRRETLKGTIQWSWALLQPAHRLALAQASLFRGGFTLKGAEAVITLPGGESVAEAIGHLREASLLQATPKPGGRLRYGFLESIRQFALEQLNDDTARGARARCQAYFQRRGSTLEQEIRGPEGVDASLELLDEEDNILGAFRGALEGGDGPGAATLLLCLRSIALTRGPADAYLNRVSKARELLPLPENTEAPPSPQALALGLFEGELYHILGEHPEAKDAFRAVNYAAAPWPKDKALQAKSAEALARLGYLEAFGGGFSLGLSLLEDALSQAKKLRDRGLEALIFDRIGSVHHLRWDLPESRRALTRALALHRRARDTSAATRAASNLGLIDLEEGRIEQSKARLSASADLDASLGNRRSEALQRLNLAALALEQGGSAEAEESLNHALNLAQGAGDRRTEGLVRIDLTLLYGETGRMAKAREEGEEAELTFEELEEPFFAGLALAHLGAVYALDGDLRGAEDAFERAQASLPPPEAHPTIQAALALIAALDHAQGDATSAQKRVAPLIEGDDPISKRSSYARLILRFLRQMGVLPS